MLTFFFPWTAVDMIQHTEYYKPKYQRKADIVQLLKKLRPRKIRQFACAHQTGWAHNLEQKHVTWLFTVTLPPFLLETQTHIITLRGRGGFIIFIISGISRFLRKWGIEYSNNLGHMEFLGSCPRFDVIVGVNQ